MTKLQVNGHYDGPISQDEYEDYKERQIKIHNKKVKRRRPRDEYDICFKHLEPYVKDGGKMICLGTRNEYEKDVFQELLGAKNITVYSQDIAELAKADYTCDFNELSKHVPHDWDIVFSNCLDHAIDASAIIDEWLKVINKGGILVIGFCFDAKNSKGDVCEFTHKSVDNFVEQHAEMEKVNNYKSGAWNYWTTRKV